MILFLCSHCFNAFRTMHLQSNAYLAGMFDATATSNNKKGPYCSDDGSEKKNYINKPNKCSMRSEIARTIYNNLSMITLAHTKNNNTMCA